MPDTRYKTNCLCLQTRRADRVLTQLYDSFIRQAGMKSTQYCLLRCISNLGEPCLTDVASALCMDQTTVSRNIDKLGQMGFITTRPSSADPRRTLISVTPLGEERLKVARAAWEQAQGAVKAGIGEEDFRQLYLLLDKIADVLGQGG